MFFVSSAEEKRPIRPPRGGSPLFVNLLNPFGFHSSKSSLDQIPTTTEQVVDLIRDRYFSWDYLTTYDFIDFIVSEEDSQIVKDAFLEGCNFILKRELSGYRFVNGQLAPITREEEINEIENAILSTSENQLKGVNIHLSEALKKMSDKKNPDFRNSIKESISAVESLCQQITSDPKAELAKALKTLKRKLPIHSGLEQGFIKIYGYTSDGDGIRHAMLDETNLDQEDALYMLIACSSFVNYLIAKASKAGINFKALPNAPPKNPPNYKPKPHLPADTTPPHTQ
ncbi:MAG: hypothetical protein IPG32_03155 [Saprospirales bacterium]|nr:hypothetical protein [Saprospirales bacterium]